MISESLKSNTTLKTLHMWGDYCEQRKTIMSIIAEQTNKQTKKKKNMNMSRKQYQ